MWGVRSDEEVHLAKRILAKAEGWVESIGFPAAKNMVMSATKGRLAACASVPRLAYPKNMCLVLAALCGDEVTQIR